jgi:hypothetical protein
MIVRLSRNESLQVIESTSSSKSVPIDSCIQIECPASMAFVDSDDLVKNLRCRLTSNGLFGVFHDGNEIATFGCSGSFFFCLLHNVLFTVSFCWN